MQIPLSPSLQRIFQTLKRYQDNPGSKYNIQFYVVGGAVRDAVLGVPPKDIDVEVYGLPYENLAEFLDHNGTVDIVGKSFGVVKYTDSDGNTYDFSVPRRDNKTGVGHKEFYTVLDFYLTPEEAGLRRDFTMNSLYWDPITQVIHDHYGGLKDIERGVLRATSPAFAEDPLRVLRGMQFAARFSMDPDPDTIKLCRSVSGEYHTLAKERICEEWMKLAIKGRDFLRGLDFLRVTGWLEFYPEILNLIGTEQEHDWHPEGDVYIHTAYVMREAAKIADKHGLTGDQRAVLLFAALCHDLGKPETTAVREVRGVPRITSWGHEDAGVPLSLKLLHRLGIKKDIVDQVLPLVRFHLYHIQDLSPKAVRRLAVRMRPSSIEMLVRLIEADYSGTGSLVGIPPGAQQLLNVAMEQKVEEKPQPNMIMGKHLIAEPYNMIPGPRVGEIVKEAYQAQLDGAFTNEEQAMTWLASRMENEK